MAITLEKIEGRWLIEYMDAWGDDYLHMETRAYIEIKPDGSGEFQFGLVHGYFYGGVSAFKKQPSRFEFTWEGNAECDDASGYGYVCECKKDVIEGYLIIGNGDKSGFMAVRE
ncbi:hypothetical protein FUAX_28590 [Fulvitalea axinellae]|uniref:Uncharacterized protein n=1 Tax=Fulvitalea axinellae TaxID=1182444 RepID=A0AAU9CTP4_9BACT|nr:hypothetical protein FUAX_28590 [Fulvitalea axinellae]